MEITYVSSSSRDLAASSTMPNNNRQIKIIPLQHPISNTSSASSSSSSLPLLFPQLSKWRSKLKRMNWIDWVDLLFPCSRWMRTYQWREYLQVDLVAGITVGVMLVPQAMSYAKLAGLHPIYGLYSSFVPIFVYAIFGSSRQLAIGPVALVSLLVSNVLGGIADSSEELYTELAILLALMVGIMECIMGFLRWLGNETPGRDDGKREAHRAIDLVGEKDGDVLESSRSKSHEEVVTLMREGTGQNAMGTGQATYIKYEDSGIRQPYQRVRRGVPQRMLTLCGSLAKSDASSPGINEYWKKYALFCTRVEAQGKGLNTIIDGGSTDNLISESVADKLHLNLVPHPKVAMLSWLQMDGQQGEISVLYRTRAKIKMGEYEESILCIVIKMGVCHLLLGRPWQWERNAIHIGRPNVYVFMWKGIRQIWVGLLPGETPVLPTSDSAAEFAESIRAIHEEVWRHLADAYVGVKERVDRHRREPDIPGARSKVVNVKLLTQFYGDIPSHPVTPSPDIELGWLIRFISHSVISGFTTASAIVIALSQAKYFLGYDIVHSSKIVPLVKSVIAGASKFSWPPFLMGSVILAILLMMKHLGKSKKNLRFLRAAGPLTAVVLGTTFVKIVHPSSISVVGDIPQGLPKFSIPKEFGHAMSLIPTAILITGVAIMESVGIAKALAAKNGYELDSNQELFGLGVANICGSFFSSYPTTGSFSRSAVNNESGAKTGLSGIIMGIIMGCALLFMTPLFREIPQCALAAIVISAVMGLVDYDEAIFLWRVDKKDFLLWTITFVTTLFLGIEIGVFVGVGFSLAFVIHESANPHTAVLGRLPGTTIYRSVQQYPEAYTYNGIVIVRIDAPIYFANISYIKERLQEYEIDIDGSTKRGPEVERIYFVIIEMAPVTYIDSSAVQALKDLHQEYKSRDIQMAITNPNRDVLLTLAKSGIIELIGKEWYFVRVHDAVQVCLQHVQYMKETPKEVNYISETKPGFLSKFWKRHGEDDETSPQSELLLSPKT
ncbi:hypothetical protein GIB67_014225 [Kingdonia uniflora]|uniref:STAS domain-containing protein n=1 Tax=Kingdonia uniflora TaxID=39325 RepID=A0A7J7M228_9MAGN|nr:hypothetical protein GIB67_014225 [Kingdonia uniflora]